MKSSFLWRCVWLFLLLGPGGFLGPAAAAVDPAWFDANQNGLIDPGSEETNYARHLASAIHARYDLNRNGTIEPAEAARIDEDARLNARSSLAALQRLRDHDRGRLSVTAAQAEIDTPAPAKPAPLFGRLLLRKAFEDFNYVNNPAVFKKAAGATLGYSNDRIAPKRTLEARGVIFFPTREPGTSGQEPWITAIGLGLDRVKNSVDAKKNVDLVSVRWLGEHEFRGSSLQWVRGSLFASTDSEFRSRQGGVTVQWEPLLQLLGGEGRALHLHPLPLLMRTRWILFNGEAGRVFADGGKPGLASGANFFRTGPKIKTELFPTTAPFDAMTLRFGWQYLAGRGTGPHDAHLIETGLVWPLDEAGHRTFELTYRKGQDPANGSARIDSLTFATGVKY